MTTGNFRQQARQMNAPSRLAKTLNLGQKAFLNQNGDAVINGQVKAHANDLTEFFKDSGSADGTVLRASAVARAMARAEEQGAVMGRGECLVVGTARGGKAAAFRSNGKERFVSLHGAIYDFVMEGVSYPATLIDTPNGLRIVPDLTQEEVMEAKEMEAKYGGGGVMTQAAQEVLEARVEVDALHALHSGAKISLGY